MGGTGETRVARAIQVACASLGPNWADARTAVARSTARTTVGRAIDSDAAAAADIQAADSACIATRATHCSIRLRARGVGHAGITTATATAAVASTAAASARTQTDADIRGTGQTRVARAIRVARTDFSSGWADASAAVARSSIGAAAADSAVGYLVRRTAAADHEPR